MDHSPRFLKLSEDARGNVTEISADELVRRQQGSPGELHLLDVREDHEWQASRIPGARHLGRGILERDIERTIPDVDASIVLYCGGGYRSALAAESLQRMGYRRVLSLAGGFRGWRDAGRPLDEAPDSQEKAKP